MPHHLTVFCVFFLFSFSCSAQLLDLAKTKSFQDSLNEYQKDPSTSEINPEEFEDFETLRFFEINEDMCVLARLLQTDHPQVFALTYSKDPNTPIYISYGKIIFTLEGTEYILTVFQNKEWLDDPNFSKHLFLPFKDWTNGPESYGGGRFIDLLIPDKGNQIILDFNRSYNPPCAYDYHMACPLIPESNHIDAEVRAGILAF